jgi:hypothetical protein
MLMKNVLTLWFLISGALQGAYGKASYCTILSAIRAELKPLLVGFRFETLEEAFERADELGIGVVGSFSNLSAKRQQFFLEETIFEIEKLPKHFIDRLRSKGSNVIELSVNNITDHPQFTYLRGYEPRGWSSGATWESATGAGGTSHSVAVYAVGGRTRGHILDSVYNVILHELGHSYDNFTGNFAISKSVNFLSAHNLDKISAPPYLRDYPEEMFASGTEMFFHSPSSKAKLKSKYPSIYYFLLDLYTE